MAWFSFFILSLFWGCSFIAIRFAVEQIPPFAAAGLRISLATVALTLVALWHGSQFPRSLRTIGVLAVAGFLNFAIPWACLFWGERFIVPALAGILNGTVPIFVLLFSWFFLPDEKPDLLKIAGVAVGFVGIVTIFAPAVTGAHVDQHFVFGLLAMIATSVAYSLGTIMIKRTLPTIDFRWGISIQGAVASISLLALSLVVEGSGWIPTLPAQTKALYSIAYLALISTALAWLLYYRLIERWGALRASAVTYMFPFVAVGVDWIYYGRPPTFREIGGALLIISGIGLIQLARTKWYRNSALSQRFKQAA